MFLALSSDRAGIFFMCREIKFAMRAFDVNVALSFAGDFNP
jgi:hypothetical protein